MSQEANKQTRRDFYKNSVIENYRTVEFSGNVAAKIRKSPNHLPFSKVGSKAISGHINWYWQKNKIEQYGGNTVVVFNICGENGSETIMRSARFPFTNEGTEQAALWTKTVFDEIIQKNK